MNIFKKILIAIIIFSAVCLNCFPVHADSVGDPNIDSGGGGMGSGTSQNFWSPGNDGVRITVVDSESGQPSLKRGGILLIQIAVGSMYMFSVPRGFSDGFIMWIKQIIATCLTTFLQSTMLVCGLILFKDHWLLGLGVMLSAGEIPRIAGMFGLETSVRPNIAGAINTAQSAVRLTQTIKTVATK